MKPGKTLPLVGRLLALTLAAVFCSDQIMAAQTSPVPEPTSQVSSNALPESPGAAQTTANSSQQDQQPAGAAAAPAPEVSGNVVSRPAGSAIAPPKQRQVRSFLIKMGLLAGAGVAIGTVAALSLASPSRVPGSH